MRKKKAVAAWQTCILIAAISGLCMLFGTANVLATQCSMCDDALEPLVLTTLDYDNTTNLTSSLLGKSTVSVSQDNDGSLSVRDTKSVILYQLLGQWRNNFPFLRLSHETRYLITQPFVDVPDPIPKSSNNKSYKLLLA